MLGARWVRETIAFLADIVAIAAFLGFTSHGALRDVVTGVLAVIGLLFGGEILVSAVSDWWGPRSPMFSGATHARRIGTGLITAALAVVLVIHVAASVAAPARHHASHKETPRPAPR